LSFDLSDERSRTAAKTFELVVNGERAAKEASARGHSTEAEMALYIVHGLLHNFGFDDSTKVKAKKMHETEDEILREFGYGLIYNKSIRAQVHKRKECCD
jgi:probable rRNA maturation factor